VNRVRLTFKGAGRWNGSDEYPCDDTPFPRIPIVGETILMPDTQEAWRVVSVEFDFENGLGQDPLVRITCEATR